MPKPKPARAVPRPPPGAVPRTPAPARERRVQSAATGELLPPHQDSERDIWGDVLQDGFTGWDEPGRSADPAGVLEQSRHLLGIGTPRRRYHDGPDVSELRQEMGI